MARKHYVILDQDLLTLFDFFHFPYETLGDKPCVPVNDFQGYIDQIDEYLLLDENSDSPYWTNYENYMDNGYVSLYWSTEKMIWEE